MLLANLESEKFETQQCMTDSSLPRSADFFAGSGLVSKALSGFFETVWANDICDKKGAVFNANHNGSIFNLGSVEHVRGQNLPKHELSWASFPCQDLSLAGNKGGIQSNRSGMVWHWLRVLDEMKQLPPVVVAENVVGLVSTKNGENYLALHSALLERGYNVGAVMLDAAHWVPQSRQRVFVIGVHQSVDHRFLTRETPTWCHSKAIQNVAQKLDCWTWWDLPEPEARQVTLDEIIDFGAPVDNSEVTKRNLSLIPQKHVERMLSQISLGHKAFPGYKRIRNGKQVLELRFDGIAGCLRTPSGGSSRQFLVLSTKDGLKTRLLTVREAARLMGAPETFQLPGTYNQGYKAMGDAVAVPAARYLAEHLLYPLSEQLSLT